MRYDELIEGEDYTLDDETGQITFLTDKATTLLDPGKDLREAWADLRWEFEQSRLGRGLRWLVDWLEGWLERHGRR